MSAERVERLEDCPAVSHENCDHAETEKVEAAKRLLIEAENAKQQQCLQEIEAVCRKYGRRLSAFAQITRTGQIAAYPTLEPSDAQ